MANSKNDVLKETLSRDLNPPGAKETVNVVDDSIRKVFTANKDGAVLAFGHSQPNAAYWVGTKHYGSGLSSRIRIRRTPSTKAKLPVADLPAA
jgi:hypothetical protein